MIISKAPLGQVSHIKRFRSGGDVDETLHPKLEIRFTREVTRVGRMGGIPSGERLSMILKHGASTREPLLSRPATGFVTDLQGKVVVRFEYAGTVSLAGSNRGAYVLAANGSTVKFVVR